MVSCHLLRDLPKPLFTLGEPNENFLFRDSYSTFVKRVNISAYRFSNINTFTKILYMDLETKKLHYVLLMEMEA